MTATLIPSARPHSKATPTVPGTAIQPLRAGSPPLPSRSTRVPARIESRPSLQQQARDLDDQARRAAAEGNIAESARLILLALQCERRVANTGPQVLQLIKPRSRG